jgi:hypothetical protein
MSIVELPSSKPRSTPTARRQGLHKLSPDLISRARDETATQVTRIGLTFVGTAAFCLLSLFSPDIALLGGSERVNVPLAGPVSFSGFMLLGPAFLIVLRIYLQIYVEHSNRLDRLARSVSLVRAPTLVPLQNSLIRLFSGLIFYLLLPMAMLLFAWKAAVFPVWGSTLLCIAAGVIVSHGMLSLSSVSWRLKALLSAGAALLAGAVIFGFGPLRLRSFDLERVNLSGGWLVRDDLRGAILQRANLKDAYLTGANLERAYLLGADLSGAHLEGTNLEGARLASTNLEGARLASANLNGAVLLLANLNGANLNAANLNGANLSDANLEGANLEHARNLTQTQLDEACGNVYTKLPEGLTLKPCRAP